MSQDFASLGINVETSSVVSGTANMHQMAAAADKLEKSVIQLSQRTIDALEKEKKAHQSYLAQVVSVIEAQNAMAESHTRKQISLLEQQKFATQAKYNSDKLMYENLFSGIIKADLAEQKRANTLSNSAQKQNHFNLMLERTLSIITAMAAYRTLSFALAIPEKILETNMDLERLKVQLEGITGSAANAKMEFQRMLALDVKTPFDIEGLTQTMIMLKNYGLEPTNMVMTTLTDTVSKLGGNTETLIGIGRQLGQAWAKDKLQQMDMRPMVENGLPVISLLGEALHKTSGEILDMSEAGTLGRREMLLLFEAMRNDAPNASARSMDTMYGALSNVKTAWQQFQDALLESKSENFIKTYFQDFSNYLFKLRDEITSTASSIGVLGEKQQEINEAVKRRNIGRDNPVLASIMDPGSTSYEVQSGKEIERKIQEYHSLKTALEQQAQAERNLQKESENRLAADAAALTLNEKSQTAKVKALDEEAKLQKSIVTTTNAAIDAQIKDLERLSVVKVDALEEERKANDRLFEEHKISADAHLTKELELIDKLTQVKKSSLQEQLTLQRSKLDEQVQSVEKAYEAIRLIETTGGNGAGQVNSTSVNYDKWAIGKGQTQLATLRNPGYGMAAYNDMESIDKIKGKAAELVEYVKNHEEELAKWGEQYYKQLVIFYGKQGLSLSESIQAATKKYGDGTDGYMEKFNKINSELTGESVKRIKLGEQEKELEANIAKVATDAAIAKQDAKHKLNVSINAALDQQIDKYKQLTMSEREYFEDQLKKQGMNSEQIAPISEQFAKNKHEEFRQKEIEDTTRSLEAYGNKVDSVTQKYSDLGSVTSAVFDGALGGVNILAGSFDNLIKSIGNTRIEQEKLNETRAELDSFTPNATKGQDEYIKQIKIRDNAESNYAKNVLKLNQQVTIEKLSGARQITGAVAGMLNKNTTEYKAAHAIEMALAGAELAIQVMKIAGIGSVTAANQASVVPYVGATMVKAEADATAAVASQATAGPYIGFALMAAMAVAMAGLGLMGGKNVSGSGEGMPTYSPDSGTVLGDSTAKSESVDKTYQLLKDIHADEYATLRSIDQGISNLHSGITNVITRLFQAGGVKNLTTQASTNVGYGTIGNSIQMGAMIGSGGLAKFDPIANKVLGFLFGGKQTSTVTAQGIQTGATSISDILSGGNLNATQFASIETKTKGGWFSKDKYSYRTQYAQLDENTQDALNNVFKSMGQTMFGLAEQLGDGLSSRVKNYIIPALTIDLKGLNGEDASKKLTGVISTALDTMSTTVFGDILGQYQQLGEGLLETAVRVVAEVNVVKDALGKSGLELSGDAIAISDALVQAAGGLKEFQQQFESFFDKFFSETEKQARLYDSLSSSMNSLNMFLPATREGYKNLVSGLNLSNEQDQKRYSMLLSLSDAADTYYKGLESANSQAQQLADETTAKANQLAQQRSNMEIQLLEAQGKSAEALVLKRQQELAAMDESLRVTQLAIYAAQDYSKAQADLTTAIQKSINEANAALDVAFAQLTKVVNAQKQDAQALLTALTTIADKLHSALDATSMVNEGTLRQERLTAQQIIQSALTHAQGGGTLANYSGLEKALTTVAKPSQELYSSFAEYALDQAKTSAAISQLSQYADLQVTDAQKALTVLEQILVQAQLQVDVLKSVNGTMTSVNGTMSSVNTSILTVPTAMSNFTVKLDAATLAQTYAIQVNTDATGSVSSAMNAFIAAGVSATASQLAIADQVAIASAESAANNALAAQLQSTASLSTTGAVMQVRVAVADLATTITTYMGRNAAAWAGATAAWAADSTAWIATAQAWNAAYNLNWYTIDNLGYRGFYQSALSTAVNASAAAKLPGFAVGINEVPYDMTANIHKGERIFPEADNKELMMRLEQLRGSELSSADLIAEIRALRYTVQKQQDALNAIAKSSSSTALNTGKTLDVLDGATAGGGPMLVEIAQ